MISFWSNDRRTGKQRAAIPKHWPFFLHISWKSIVLLKSPDSNYNFYMINCQLILLWWGLFQYFFFCFQLVEVNSALFLKARISTALLTLMSCRQHTNPFKLLLPFYFQSYTSSSELGLCCHQIPRLWAPPNPSVLTAVLSVLKSC